MHRRTMWELVLRSCLRRTRAPEVRPSSDNVIIPKHVMIPTDVIIMNTQGNIIDSKLFPEGTCTSCQHITLQYVMNNPAGHQLQYLPMYCRDRPTNCPMCRIIFNCIWNGNEITGYHFLTLGADAFSLSMSSPDPDTRRRRIWEVDIMRNRAEDPWERTGWWYKFRIYAEPGKQLCICSLVCQLRRLIILDSYASTFVRSRRPPLSNLSDITFQRITRWIKDCDETHSNCRDHASQSSDPEFRYLPTRVVHVGSATQQPHIHISEKHQNSRYVALSHCWGKIPQVKTLEENIEQHKKGIVFERLSKTFQDALRTTRRLGIEFIWIDSLCIVQDDRDDWLRESKRMGSVYANAYLTLAATSSTDGSGGLNGVRPDINWTKFPCDGTDRTKGYMWCTDASWTSHEDLDYAPLNSRGWVFQEKILSRRIIHFASSQVYWECKQRFFGEECEDDPSFTGSTIQPSIFWANVNAISDNETTAIKSAVDVRNAETSRSQLDEFYASWWNLIYFYGKKDFTKQGDRLVALLGIIRVVEKKTRLHCFDGHWEDSSQSFLRDLMWFPYEEQKTLSVLNDGERSRLCSSWSWASLEGHVTHRHLFASTWTNYGLKNCDLRLEVIEEKVHVPWPSHPLKVSGMLRTFYRCKCRGNDYTYPPKDGRMRVLYKCECRKGEYVEQRIHQVRTFLVKLEEHGSACGWICFDREDEEPEQFYLSPVYVATQSIACLALVQRSRPESSERWFERVGVGNIEMVADDAAHGYTSTYAKMDLFEGCERETYYIV